MRFSRYPTGYCSNCGSMTSRHSIVCPGCGWFDPPTTGEKPKKVKPAKAKKTFGESMIDNGFYFKE